VQAYFNEFNNDGFVCKEQDILFRSLAFTNFITLFSITDVPDLAASVHIHLNLFGV
jgi:hypothetical protein